MSSPASGDQAQQSNGAINASDFDPNFLIDPFVGDSQPKDKDEARARYVFHATRLNMMHNARKQANNKYHMNYASQGQLVASSIADAVAVMIGMPRVNELIADYNTNKSARAFVLLAQTVRNFMMPKLLAHGPAPMRDCIYSALNALKDLEYRPSCYNHVVSHLVSMFTGIKSTCLMLDSHREQNPGAYANEIPFFKFADFFTVTRHDFCTWLLPVDDDSNLGNYDYWFET